MKFSYYTHMIPRLSSVDGCRAPEGAPEPDTRRYFLLRTNTWVP